MYVCMKYVCMYMCVRVCMCVLCSIEKESEPGLPIEEDPIAHVLLKRLLNLELSLETQGSEDGGDGDGSGTSGVDISMWMNPHKFPEKKETKKGDKKNKKNKAAIATPAEEGQGNAYLSIGCYICICMYVCMDRTISF